jgi:hypothetical protein
LNFEFFSIRRHEIKQTWRRLSFSRGRTFAVTCHGSRVLCHVSRVSRSGAVTWRQKNWATRGLRF